MTEFEETSKKIQDLVDEVFKQGIGVGYDHGLEVGTHNGYKRGYQNRQKNAVAEYNGTEYLRGLDDAWECARKIIAMFTDADKGQEKKRKDIFGNLQDWETFDAYSASEAIAKIKEYEQRPPDKVNITELKAVCDDLRGVTALENAIRWYETIVTNNKMNLKEKPNDRTDNNDNHS